MKSYIITEQQIVDCFKLGEANDPAGLLKLTATLLEHTPSVASDRGDCHKCLYVATHGSKMPCRECSHAGGQVDYWQPRTP